MITSRSLQTLLSKSAVQWALVPGFTILTAFGSFLKIPLAGTPVPFTLQTFFVLLSGLILGSAKATLSQALFVGLAAGGLPWLASGPSLFSPGAGYVLGFVAAAWIMGNASSHCSTLKLLGCIVLAEIVLFTMGLSYLKIWTASSWNQTLSMGLWPFVGGELLKMSSVFLIGIRIHSLKRDQ